MQRDPSRLACLPRPQRVFRRVVAPLFGVLSMLAGSCGGESEASGVDRDIHVVRHAQAWSNVPEAERGGRSGDAADALTPDGVKQAEAAAAALKGAGLTVVFHSPLGRTRETAEIIARECGVPAVPLEGLRPMGEDETVAATTARVIAALTARDEAGSWALVSHSGATAALLGEVDGTPEDERLKRKLETGGMRKVRWLADGTWQAP